MHTHTRAQACTGVHTHGRPPGHEGQLPVSSLRLPSAKAEPRARGHSASACRVTRSPSHGRPEEGAGHVASLAPVHQVLLIPRSTPGSTRRWSKARESLKEEERKHFSIESSS